MLNWAGKAVRQASHRNKPIVLRRAIQQIYRGKLGTSGRPMTAKISWHKDVFDLSSAIDSDDEYHFLQRSIALQLRHGFVERLETNHIQASVADRPQISGAIFLSLQPKQLRFLIADARISIVLALQRHLTNEQYRRRLVKEFHYRALRLHLSDQFRLLMVPQSNSAKYRFSAERRPNLASAYQAEIERLEATALDCTRSFPGTITGDAGPGLRSHG